MEGEADCGVNYYMSKNKQTNKQKQAKQNKTKQNKTKQNKTKQNKTKQNKTKQNKTKQNKNPLCPGRISQHFKGVKEKIIGNRSLFVII